MSILFTSGATVTFRALLDEVVSAPFLEFLQQLGFRRISLQYGNEKDPKTGAQLSKQYLSELLAARKIVEQFHFDLANETNDKAVTVFRNASLTLEVFGFSDNIGSYIRSADLVVSHAGTGSIMDTLRSKKPLIVVTNDSLKDSHQDEIATRFEAEGYLSKVSEPELAAGRLRAKIEQWKNGGLVFDALPDPPGGVLAHVISQEVQDL